MEVNLELPVERDRSILVGLVDELAHGEDVVTWFFFWEPELRLRLRWGGEARREAVRARLDRAVADGLVSSWREESYEGEAEMYGAEVWPVIQKDWMNGSELALLFAKLERAGALTRTRSPSVGPSQADARSDSSARSSAARAEASPPSFTIRRRYPSACPRHSTISSSQVP